MEDQDLTVVRGRLLSCELVLAHLVWAFARNTANPPATLASLWNGIEDRIAALSRAPDLDQAMIAAAQENIAAMGQALLDAVSADALRMNDKPDSEPH